MFLTPLHRILSNQDSWEGQHKPWNLHRNLSYGILFIFYITQLNYSTWAMT